jgi:hypothetical protein
VEDGDGERLGLAAGKFEAAEPETGRRGPIDGGTESLPRSRSWRGG